jgi:hypothetical protein
VNIPVPYSNVFVIGFLGLLALAAMSAFRGEGVRTLISFVFAGGQIHWIVFGVTLVVSILWAVVLLLGVTPAVILRSSLLLPGVALGGGLLLLGLVFGQIFRATGTQSLTS